MLNSRFFILLIAVNSALSLKKDTRLGKKPASAKPANCEKIKCPAVEQPICAKLVYRNAGNKTVYVVMVNKCEMNYVKCHEGLEAVVVPMKSCGHNNFIKNGSKRSKRDAEDDATSPPGMPEIKHMILPVDEQLQEANEEISKEYINEDTPIKGDYDYIPLNEKYDEANDKNGDENVPNGIVSSDNNLNTDEPGYDDEYDEVDGNTEFVIVEGKPPHEEVADEPDIGDLEENSGSEYAPDKIPRDDLEDQDVERFEDIDDADAEESGYYEKDSKEAPDKNYHQYVSEDESVEDDYEYQGEESYRYSYEYEGHNDKKLLNNGVDLTGNLNDNVFHNRGVNLKEYHGECPTVCPSRDIMVCAKCQHGVFRTFLTTCHMRMFGCQHTDESLELIARVPCVMSAPYLSDATMQPAGRVREPSDDDRVLRFLRCRELSHQSREGDPRCKFVNDKDTRLMEEPQKVDDNY